LLILPARLDYQLSVKFINDAASLLEAGSELAGNLLNCTGILAVAKTGGGEEYRVCKAAGLAEGVFELD
jgi:hypothetical protein